MASGLYETLQFPLSYLSTEREEALVRACAAANMGFIAMKGLAGGLLTNARACMAYMSQFDNVVPIWGIQRQAELDQWLGFMDEGVGEGVVRLRPVRARPCSTTRPARSSPPSAPSWQVTSAVGVAIACPAPWASPSTSARA